MSGAARCEIGRPAPRCPVCRWHLAFEAHDGDWRGRCWNPSCPRDEVHPVTPTEAEVLEIADRYGELTSPLLCSILGLKPAAASMRLRTMEQAGILARDRVVPAGGGRLFRYRVVGTG